MYPDNEEKSLSIWTGYALGQSRWGILWLGKYYDLIDAGNNGLNSWFELPHDVMIEGVHIPWHGVSGGPADRRFAEKILT